MPYLPNEKLSLVVEIQINGVWITITSRARRAGGLVVRHGRSDGAIQGEASRCAITIGNDDGYLTEGNPMSPWYPYIGRGTPIRISLADVLASPARRFTGEIDGIDMAFPGSGTCVVRVEAVGALGVIAQNNDPLRSPMFRSMSGVTGTGVVPYAYWSMEDKGGSAAIVSGLAGGLSVPVPNGVSLASAEELAGSETLVSINAGASLTIPVPAYADQDLWAVQIALKVPNEPAGTTAYVEAITDGSGTVKTWALEYVPGAPGEIRSMGYDASGTFVNGGTGIPLLGTSPSNPAESSVYDKWLVFTVAAYQVATTDIGFLGATDGATGAVFFGAGSASDPTTHSALSAVRINGGTTGVQCGHLAVFVDPSLPIDSDLNNVGPAMDGWTGDQAHERVERLCREEGLTAVIYGSSSSTMGPQRTASLFSLLQDCERADQGYLFDAIDDVAIAYRTREDLYNQSPSIAISKGALTKELMPRWDNQQVANDWTLTRVGGSSARASDEGHVAATRRRSVQSLTVNLETDAVLNDHAGWRLAIGTTPGPRYTEGGINLRNDDGAKLADAVLALIPGDRITAAAKALPLQHPPDGFDQMVIGWVEELDAREWLLHPNLIPSRPHSQVGVYGTDPGGVVSRYGAANTVLAEDLTDVETAADVNSNGDVWITTATHPAQFPFDVTIGGMNYSCTAITGTAPNYTFILVRLAIDKTHSAGAAVQVTDVGRYGL